jgi:hypothetical protein
MLLQEQLIQIINQILIIIFVVLVGIPQNPQSVHSGEKFWECVMIVKID